MTKSQVFSLLGFLCILHNAYAGIVYSNPNSGRPGLISDNPCGDEITLAGTDRFVTSIAIGVAQVGGVEGEASFQLTLYHNDGPDVVPHTILWQSPWYKDYYIEGNDSVVIFDVPYIEAPETFTWTLDIKNSWPQSTCYSFGDGPTIGSSKSYHWYHHKATNTWHQTYPTGDEPVNFVCRVNTLQRQSIIPPGDFDKSHIVDFKDFVVLAAHWLDTNVDEANDIIPDQTVNMLDLELFVKCWLYDFRCVPCKQTCHNHLKRASYCLQFYAMDHRDDLPSSLQELVDYSIEIEDDISRYLFCPCSTDAVGTISYAYRGSGLDYSVSASTILMYDKTGKHADCPELRNVLFADGHVAAMNEEELQQAIEQDNLWRARRGMPELPME